jgi:hypothetical protein
MRQHGESVTDLAAESLARSGRLRLRATGASMLPALRPGDELDFVSDARAVEAGDIVLWRREGGLVVHRVRARDGDNLLTQGDALRSPDAPLSMAQVLGKLESCRRKGSDRTAGRAGVRDRAWAWLLCRSQLATRIFLRWHRFTQRVPA